MITQSMRDLWVVYRNQKNGVRLDLKGGLLRPASPLYQATARSLPGFGLWAGRVVTVSLRERGRTGFVQARWRSGFPALDLLYIAPALESRPGAVWLWPQLLNKMVRVGGEHGVQRLFAHLPEEHHAEVEVMRQAGFAIYAQDSLYRCLARPRGRGESRWQPFRSVDEWGLHRLYNAVTPAVVQQAESTLLAGQNGHRSYHGWWGSTRHGCYILPGELEGEVHGWLRLTRGEHGHWLKLVLHPEVAPHAAGLVEEGLCLMAGWPDRPIYCDVRDYEGYLTDALGRAGFERVMRRVLLVRHTTHTVRVERKRTIPVLEAAPETAPTSF